MNRRHLTFAVLVLGNLIFMWRVEPHLEKPEVRQTASEVETSEGPPAAPIFSSRGKTAGVISKLPMPSRRIAEESSPPPLRAARVFAPRESDLGDTLESIGLASWKIWRGVGIAQRGSEPRDAKLTGEVAGYSLFESSSFLGRLGQFDLAAPIAVYNDRTHKAGVITGSIRIILKDGVRWDDFAKDHDVSLIAPFPHLRAYIVTSPRSPFDLAALLNEIAGDSRIENSKAEVLSRDFNKN